jgi:hypothetical protein
VSDQTSDIATMKEEVLALHRQLAAARLDASNGWHRYEAANQCRIASEKLVEARAIENLALAQDLKTTVDALQAIDSICMVLYEGGFHQQMIRNNLADRREFEKIIGLAQSWLRLKTPRAARTDKTKEASNACA